MIWQCWRRHGSARSDVAHGEVRQYLDSVAVLGTACGSIRCALGKTMNPLPNFFSILPFTHVHNYGVGVVFFRGYGSRFKSDCPFDITLRQ